MMPDDFLCHKDHLWVKLVEPNTALVGVTHYAQYSLGEVVYVDCPNVATRIEQGDAFGTIESVKIVSDLISPVSGTVLAVNSALSSDPCCVNRDPYGEGWIVKVQLQDESELDELMSGVDYEKKVSSSSA